MLIVVVAVCLTSCGDDIDEPEAEYKDIKQALLWQYDTYLDNPLNVVAYAKTDWSKFPYTEIKGLVDEMNVLKSKYKYYSFDGESCFYVFNRIEGRSILQC